MTELIDSDAMYRKLLQVGEEWADKKAAYQELDSCTKSVLADCMDNFRQTTSSRIEAESFALRSAQYREHLAAVSAANKAFLRAQVKYESLKTLIELRRSEEATRRAETRVL